MRRILFLLTVAVIAASLAYAVAGIRILVITSSHSHSDPPQ